jgi:hypothetical protein
MNKGEAVTTAGHATLLDNISPVTHDPDCAVSIVTEAAPFPLLEVEFPIPFTFWYMPIVTARIIALLVISWSVFKPEANVCVVQTSKLGAKAPPRV